MPTIDVFDTEGQHTHRLMASPGRRLVLVLEDGGVDILHRCGGQARCTTCRVEFLQGEPPQMTQAEQARLREERVLQGVRLACQILCEDDMALVPLIRLSDSLIDDVGKRPSESLTPSPEWIASHANPQDSA